MGESCLVRARHSPDVGTAIVDEAITAVLSTVDLTTVLERTGRLLRRHFGETRVTINRLLHDQPGVAEVALVNDPRCPAPEMGTRFPLEGSACGAALAAGQRVIVDPIDPAAPRFREEAAIAGYGYGSLVSFPLVFDGQPLGSVDIAHLPDEGLLDCCLETAGRVAGLVAIALHNSLMVEEIRRLNRLLDRENARLREELREATRDVRYVAESPRMKEVVERVRLVAGLDTTVLIRGETGTGKEGLARMVHELGPRFERPFVVVNLGAIPDTLIESELFGHEKGAFTGALARKLGRFEQAEGGTIFLDEIGDAPPTVQVRLLRVLQEREIQRVGGSDTIKVDVRVVAATNRHLEKMVESGAFRADLYYRLNAFPINLPPLRERPEDVRPLGTYFLTRQAALMHRRPPAVSDEIWRTLERSPWPGNVRELENFLQRALILSPGAALVLPPADHTPGDAPLPVAVDTSGAGVRSFDEEMRALLQRALQSADGKIYGPDGAAARLGLPPTTLQGKLRRYGLAVRR